MSLKLSVIVPMYNVEPYLERCIRSMENQDIPEEDYEIICINDGSKDNCKSIIETLQKEFDNIRLIDQENQGVSRARNNGIGQAGGDYLLFVDPDDYVEASTFGRILHKAYETNAEVSFLGFTVLDEKGNEKRRIFNELHSDICYTGPQAYFVARSDRDVDPDRLWAVLLKREFMALNSLKFLPDVPFLEDGELISRILCLAERCIFDGRSFYQRTTRPGSATNSKLFSSEKATRGFFLAAENLKNFQNRIPADTERKEFLNQPICKFVILIIDPSRISFKPGLIAKLDARLKASDLRRLELKSVDNEYTRLGRWYNISVWVFVVCRIIDVKLKAIRLHLARN